MPGTRGFSLHSTYSVAPARVRRIIAMEERFRGLKTNGTLRAERHGLLSFRQLR